MESLSNLWQIQILLFLLHNLDNLIISHLEYILSLLASDDMINTLHFIFPIKSVNILTLGSLFLLEEVLQRLDDNQKQMTLVILIHINSYRTEISWPHSRQPRSFKNEYVDDHTLKFYKIVKHCFVRYCYYFITQKIIVIEKKIAQ